jgi:hypothetical protein
MLTIYSFILHISTVGVESKMNTNRRKRLEAEAEVHELKAKLGLLGHS